MCMTSRRYPLHGLTPNRRFSTFISTLLLLISVFSSNVVNSQVYYQEAFIHGPGVWTGYSGDAGVQHDFGIRQADTRRGQTIGITVSVAEGVPYWYGGITGDIQADFPAKSIDDLPGLVVEFELWSSQGAPGGIEVWAKDPKTGGSLKTTVIVQAGQWNRVSLPFTQFSNEGFTFPRGMWEFGFNLNPYQNMGVGWVFEVQIDNIRIFRSNTGPRITSETAIRATLGLPFLYEITANGAGNAYAATGLPDGLRLNPATGAISGIPTQSGDHTIALAVTNPDGSAQATLRLTVGAGATEVVYRQDFINGTAEWFAFAGDVGVTHRLTTARDGPAGLAALTLTATVRDATYWYGGAGMAATTPFPAANAEAAVKLAARFDIRSSKKLADGFNLGIKPHGTPGTGLQIAFDAPGDEWTAISIPFSRFNAAQLASFNYAATPWEITIAPANTERWGYEGDFSFSVARFMIMRESTR